MHKAAKGSDWPRKVTLGRISVPVYRRKMQNGAFGCMVTNDADGVRRFDSYATKADALEAARNLARQLGEQNVLAASIAGERGKTSPDRQERWCMVKPPLRHATTDRSHLSLEAKCPEARLD